MMMSCREEKIHSTPRLAKRCNMGVQAAIYPSSRVFTPHASFGLFLIVIVMYFGAAAPSLLRGWREADKSLYGELHRWCVHNKSYDEIATKQNFFRQLRLTHDRPSLFLLLSVFSSLTAGGIYAAMWLPLLLKCEYEASKLFHRRGIRGKARITRKSEEVGGCGGPPRFKLTFAYLCRLAGCPRNQPPPVVRSQWVPNEIWNQYELNDPIEILVVPEYRDEGRVRSIAEYQWDEWIHPGKHRLKSILRVMTCLVPVIIMSLSVAFLVSVLYEAKINGVLIEGLVFSLVFAFALLLMLLICSARKAERNIRYVHRIQSLSDGNSGDEQMQVLIADAERVRC